MLLASMFSIVTNRRSLLVLIIKVPIPAELSMTLKSLRSKDVDNPNENVASATIQILLRQLIHLATFHRLAEYFLRCLEPIVLEHQDYN